MRFLFKKISLIFICLVFYVLFSPSIIYAANLRFAPSSGSYAVGRNFSVGVYVSTPNQAINAVSGIISFPSDKLEVVSLTRGGSILTLWVQEPSFSNTNGTVNFEGVVLNPGFIGANGRIITVNFRSKSSGEAKLNFSSSSVLANDGAGTNILMSSGEANFNITNILVLPRPEENILPIISGNLPSAPNIVSSTHPDSNFWYTDNNPKFNWGLQEGITAVGLLVSRSSRATPTVVHSPAISAREILNVEDGIWYLHARFRNENGWGNIATFRFQIDRTSPTNLQINEIQRDDKTTPRARFTFSANDETSGIKNYEIQINQDDIIIWQHNEGTFFETPTLPPGNHILTVRAVDMAGNKIASFAEFKIKAITPPYITHYPSEIQTNNNLIIRGNTHPSSLVTMVLQREGRAFQDYTTESDTYGNFIFVIEEVLQEGLYRASFKSVDTRGAQSVLSEPIIINITRPVILKIGEQAITVLAVLVPLIALIIILIGIIWWIYRKIILFKKRIRKETKDVSESLQQAFAIIRNAMEKQIEKMDNKPGLSVKEKKLNNSLKKVIQVAEEFVIKEIDDIEKELK